MKRKPAAYGIRVIQKHAVYGIRAPVTVAPYTGHADLVPLSSFYAFIISMEHPMPLSALE